MISTITIIRICWTVLSAAITRNRVVFVWLIPRHDPRRGAKCIGWWGDHVESEIWGVLWFPLSPSNSTYPQNHQMNLHPLCFVIANNFRFSSKNIAEFKCSIWIDFKLVTICMPFRHLRVDVTHDMFIRKTWISKKYYCWALKWNLKLHRVIYLCNKSAHNFKFTWNFSWLYNLKKYIIHLNSTYTKTFFIENKISKFSNKMTILLMLRCKIFKLYL